MTFAANIHGAQINPSDFGDSLSFCMCHKQVKISNYLANTFC